jgi:aspartyl protease family protein
VSDGDAPRVLYLVLCIVLVASSLVGMRLPVAKAAKMVLAWVAIFGVFFMIFAFRGEFSALGQRLRAEATGTPVDNGAEIRIPMSDDGHFWVSGEVNDTQVRFLVDSGASTTTISQEAARAASINPRDSGYISTANGTAQVGRGYADELRIGSIERLEFPLLINPNDDTSVLGMNFLSSLTGWRVEGNYLVLRP